MNNQVIFAAAGNGKTYSICSQARSAVSGGNKCVLLISYAVNNPKESKVFRSVEIKVGDIIIPAFKFVTG